MVLSKLRLIVPILSLASALHAAGPDISNLNNCINEIRQANMTPPVVPTFDLYKSNYRRLIADLEAATPTMPYVYQEAAAKPLIQYLRSLGEAQFLRIFSGLLQDNLSQSLQQIIPDACLAVLFHNTSFVQSVNAFQEIASDLYDSFISEEARVGKETGRPINAPTYGVIPPLVKFGNADAGPYTWPCDATTQLLGVRCALVSMPPAQIKGGLLAWSSLGHETSGHDILHADAGLLDELAQKVYATVLSTFQSQGLATYWANCIDESASDVCGYLNMGPSAGIGLIGYFRSLGNGKLRNVGFLQGPHPIDLLRGYLAAAVAKRLHFKSGNTWSKTLFNETKKDNDTLFLLDQRTGQYSVFPVPLEVAIASTEVVAEVIMRTKLDALQGYSLQDIQDWTDNDQKIMKDLIAALDATGQIPATLRGPGFYAAHVIGASTLAALRQNASVTGIFGKMLAFLQTMHLDNPTWSKKPTKEALQLLERLGVARPADQLEARPAIVDVPGGENLSGNDADRFCGDVEDDDSYLDEEEVASIVEQL